MNHKLLKKAYKIDFDRIEEGYLASDQWCYAEDRNKAKKQLLNKVGCEDWKLMGEDEEINYLTIPVVRAKKLDMVDFEGKEVQRYRIGEIIAEKERIDQLDNILADNGIEYCYIVKGGIFYRPNNCGYTERQSRAGIYKKEDAVHSAKSCSELWVRTVNIPEHNNMINAEISELKERLIATQ